MSESEWELEYKVSLREDDFKMDEPLQWWNADGNINHAEKRDYIGKAAQKARWMESRTQEEEIGGFRQMEEWQLVPTGTWEERLDKDADQFVGLIEKKWHMCVRELL